MLLKNKIIEALNAKAEDFTQFERELNSDSLFYDQKLAEFIASGYKSLLESLAKFPAAGAIPSKEFLESKN